MSPACLGDIGDIPKQARVHEMHETPVVLPSHFRGIEHMNISQGVRVDISFRGKKRMVSIYPFANLPCVLRDHKMFLETAFRGWMKKNTHIRSTTFVNLTGNQQSTKTKPAFFGSIISQKIIPWQSEVYQVGYSHIP